MKKRSTKKPTETVDTAAAAATTAAAVSTTQQDTVVAASAPAPAPRKRESKKKFNVVAVVTPDGIQGDFMAEQRRPLIAHLPIHSSEVVFYDTPIQYNPSIPQPESYDEEFEMYATTSETIQHQESIYEAAPEHVVEEEPKTEEQVVAEKQLAQPTLPVYTKAELLVQYKGAQQSRTIPESSTAACFWCCHAFDGQPCVIPVRDMAGVYEVYGNFCCPECALAYVLEEHDDSHVKWEKVALLHRLYSGTVAGVDGGRIYPAPARGVLKLFGGDVSIETYRATIRERKVRVDLHLPPMISILATMDTKPIDFYETTIPKSLVALNTDRVQKVEEGLRLKRTKTLKDRESTLDAVMNLQIRRVPTVSMAAMAEF
jgi:hypothetical protein